MLKKKTKHGGTRPGAGRPKSAKGVTREIALEYFQDKILEKFDELIKTMIDSALGAPVMHEETKNGKKYVRRVYKNKPNAKALEYLFTTVVGKADEDEASKKKIIIEFSDYAAPPNDDPELDKEYRERFEKNQKNKNIPARTALATDLIKADESNPAK